MAFFVRDRSMVDWIYDPTFPEGSEGSWLQSGISFTDLYSVLRKEKPPSKLHDMARRERERENLKLSTRLYVRAIGRPKHRLESSRRTGERARGWGRSRNGLSGTEEVPSLNRGYQKMHSSESERNAVDGMQRCTTGAATGSETYREGYNGCPGRERRRMETMKKAKREAWL